MRLPQFVAALIALVCLSVWSTGVSLAQVPTREGIERSTVSVITGAYGSLSARLTADLAAILDEDDNLRVLPVAGRGAVSDIADVLFLRGMDIAIIPANVMDYAENNRLYPTMKRKLQFVTRLYIQVAHLVTSKDISSVADLNGRTINVVSKYDAAFVTAQTVFDRIGLNYQPAYIDQRTAIQKIKQGELAATLIMSGRPSPILSEIEKDSSLRLIEIPFRKNLPPAYFPSYLSSADYPNLVEPGQTIASIGTSAIMMVYNFKTGTERYAKVARFIDAFLSRLGEFQRVPWHPRWQDINVTATVRGWQRFGPVAQWLRNNPAPAAVAARTTGRRSLRELFKAFIDSQVGAGQSEQLLRYNKEELFKRFVAWQKTRRLLVARQPAVRPKPKPKRSLRILFRQFIAEEVKRIGKENVLALSKRELYQRFLAWRRRSAANAN